MLMIIVQLFKKTLSSKKLNHYLQLQKVERELEHVRAKHTTHTRLM